MFWTNLVIDILLFVYVFDCAFMGLIILMQRSKQEGLGAAFGGGFTESVFGAQTSNVLVKATVWAAILFFILSITLARLYSHVDASASQGSPVQQLLAKPLTTAKPVTPAATPAPAPTSATPAPSTATTPVTTAPIAPKAAPASPAAPANK